MVQLGACKRIMIVGPHREHTPLHSTIVEDRDENGEGDGEAMTGEFLVTKERQKRKCSTSRQVERLVPAWSKKQKRSSGSRNTKIKEQLYKTSKRKEQHCARRWSAERYKLAEENMFRIMKEEEAVSGNPIPRSSLRTAARKYIGDTGLLDHLLKHMDGKVTPGGSERFRRRHNFNGMMEYWLEDAGLVLLREEAGVKDPFWIPPPGWVLGDGHSQDLDYARELKLLKEEMAKIKRDAPQLSKKQDEDQANVTPSSSVTNQKSLDGSFLPSQEMNNEVKRWKSKTEQQLMDISSSLSSMQETFEGMDKWKTKIEQKLTDLSSSLSNMQVSKQYSTFSPSASDNWKWWGTDLVDDHRYDYPPWLDSGDLIDIKQEEIAPWLDGSDLVNNNPEAAFQNPSLCPAPEGKPSTSSSEVPACTTELDLLNEDMMTKMKREFQELIPVKLEDNETNVTPDSSAATDSKLDLDDSLLILQDMYKQVVNWKAKIEQQVTEISKTLGGMQA